MIDMLLWDPALFVHSPETDRSSWDDHIEEGFSDIPYGLVKWAEPYEDRCEKCGRIYCDHERKY